MYKHPFEAGTEWESHHMKLMTEGEEIHMKIVISNAALTWFKNEMGLQKGDKVKFFAQIYGSSPVQQNYALGLTIDNSPVDLAVSTEVEGIEFYVEAADVWFFDGHDLHVDYNEKTDEIEYKYIKP